MRLFLAKEERAKKVREISFQVASGECVSDEDFAFLIQFGNVKMVQKFIDNCWKKMYWHDGAFAGYTTDIIGAYSLSLEALIVAGYTDIFVDFFGNARNCFVCWGSKLIIPLYEKGETELIKYVWDSFEIGSCGGVLV